MNQRNLIWLLIFMVVELALILFVDRPIAEYMQILDQTHPDLINIFRAYTDLGKSKWYLWPAVLSVVACAILFRLPHFAAQRAAIAKAGNNLLFFFASIAVSGLVTDIIKRIVGRARPVELVRDNFYGFHPINFHAVFNSMPSGHTTTAAALATSLMILLPRGRYAWLLIWLFLGMSRVMVNAHFLSDVVAGTAVGLLTALYLQGFRTPRGMFPYTKGIFPIDKA